MWSSGVRACGSRRPGDNEWGPLADALRDYVDLKGDSRFATAQLRAEHDRDLRDALATIFTKEPAAQWETRLTRHDIGCVAVHMDALGRQLQCVDALVAQRTKTTPPE
jgi:crotonobetainyl-CoA:carnitine CoA-transferase CaiB-like acyl-CoA transferase